MRRLLTTLLISLTFSYSHAQTTAPLEVVNSGITAVNDLGKQIVLGKYKTALDKMYPQWKERVATRVGGEPALEKQFDELTASMTAQGISMISFTSFGFPKVYEVFPGKITETIDGKQVEKMTSTKWMLLIPTKTKFRKISSAETMVVESQGFQVAISDKSKLDWSFIDGANITTNDLRAMFLTLPADMELPEVKRSLDPK